MKVKFANVEIEPAVGMRLLRDGGHQDIVDMADGPLRLTERPGFPGAIGPAGCYRYALDLARPWVGREAINDTGKWLCILSVLTKNDIEYIVYRYRLETGDGTAIADIRLLMNKGFRWADGLDQPHDAGSKGGAAENEPNSAG